MVDVTLTKTTTQLDLFLTIKSTLKSNTTIKAYFKDKDFYEFEPSVKELNSNSFPYIVISIPSTETDLLTFKTTTKKTFTVDLLVAWDFSAKDKYRSIINNIISALEAAETTFDALGYYNLKIDSDGHTIDYISDKKVIAGGLTLTFSGAVNR